MYKSKALLDTGNEVIFELEYGDGFNFEFTGRCKVSDGDFKESVTKDHLVFVKNEEYLSVMNFLQSLRS